jgi:hemolysin activation/secretion protein
MRITRLLTGLWLMFALTNFGVADEAAAEKPKFDIFEYQVIGTSLLPQTQVEKAVYGYLGPQKTIDDVENARKALEQEYRKAGFATVTVDIPEQEVNTGVVKLRVNESKVAKVRVTGSHYYSQGRILEQVPSVAAGKTPNFTAFQSDLQTVNRFPGNRVTPILKPGLEPGTTDVELNVEDKNPLSGSVELNNHYSPNTTHTRLTGTAAYANLWQLGHTVSLQYQTAPEKVDEARVWVATYLAPLPDSDKLAVFYYVRSRSSVAALSDLTVIGNGDIYGARLISPLPSSGSYYHSLTLGVDYKDFQENIDQPGTAGVQTPIRYWPLSLTYGGSVADPHGQWEFSTGVASGLRDAGSNDLDFDNKRFKARGNYFIYKWDVQRTQALSKTWSVIGRIDGQIADQPLVSNEEMSAGGSSTVRGFLESEEIADNGIHASLEFRGPSLWSRKDGSGSLQPIAFTEAAHLWLRDPLPAQQRNFNLSSAGVGLRFKDGRRIDATLDLAFPFQNTNYTQAGQPRLQFSTVVHF